MLGQVRVQSEGFLAHLTMEGLLSCVGPVVSNEVRGQAEGFPTLGTAVAVDVAVGALQVGEQQGLAEGFPTLCTLPGLLPAVRALVAAKVGAAPEALPAVHAQERPLPGVDPEVLQQACVLAEPLRALPALVGLLAPMGLLMSHQVRASLKGFPTLRTLMAFVSATEFLASSRAGALTHIRGTELGPRVHTVVFSQL